MVVNNNIDVINRGIQERMKATRSFSKLIFI
jgi:hypothetical protein